MMNEEAVRCCEMHQLGTADRCAVSAVSCVGCVVIVDERKHTCSKYSLVMVKLLSLFRCIMFNGISWVVILYPVCLVHCRLLRCFCVSCVIT